MRYKVVMAALTPGYDNSRLLDAAVHLARRFDSALIGVAACRPIHCLCRDYLLPAGLFEQDRVQIDRHLGDAERSFRVAAAQSGGPVDWNGRSCTEPLAEHLANEAAAADIVVTPLPGRDEPRDETRHPDLSDLVMQAGRPILLLPASTLPMAFDRILVAWKNTREARRAIADALPMLQAAVQVFVVEFDATGDITAARDSLARVGQWLARHGVKAETRAMPSTQAHATEITNLARSLDVGLVVAGAYGHNRQGRWVLGGVTSELLEGGQCALLSH